MRPCRPPPSYPSGSGGCPGTLGGTRRWRVSSAFVRHAGEILNDARNQGGHVVGVREDAARIPGGGGRRHRGRDEKEEKAEGHQYQGSRHLFLSTSGLE